LLAILLIGAVVLVGFGAVLGGLGLSGMFPEVNAYFEMGVIATEIEIYREQNGQLPTDLSVLGLEQAQLTDHWGNAYDYRPQTGSNQYMLLSAGGDGQMGTGDDIEVNTSTPGTP
jgi:hypothetical protein